MSKTFYKNILENTFSSVLEKNFVKKILNQQLGSKDFICDNAEKIRIEYFCDGRQECSDGSDEISVKSGLANNIENEKL